MIGLLTTAFAGPVLQVGTGQRILDLPTTVALGGGGIRFGEDLGRVMPFVGATATFVRVKVDPDESTVSTFAWTAMLGARIDLADEDGPAQPFVAAGGTMGTGRLGVAFTEFDERSIFDLTTGPGGFAGAGADAALSPKVWVGVEVGASVARGGLDVILEEGARRNVEADWNATGIWTYADLHLSFRLGSNP